MNKELQLFYYNAGNNYWWTRGKYNLVLDLISKFCHENILPKNKISKIFDIGSGPGNMLDFLKNYGEIFGNDISEEAISFCKGRGFKMIDGNIDAEDMLVDDNSFNLITMIDVLEHLNNDGLALAKAKKLLAPGGQLVITVPAYQFLWGHHDIKNCHKRRYTLKELKSKLIASDFLINKISYFEPLFLPPLIFLRIIKYLARSNKDDFIKTPKLINNILLKLIEAEKYYLRHFNFCFGATIIAIAQKKK